MAAIASVPAGGAARAWPVTQSLERVPGTVSLVGQETSAIQVRLHVYTGYKYVRLGSKYVHQYVWFTWVRTNGNYVIG